MKKAPPEKRRPRSDDEPRRVTAKPRKRTEGDNYDYGDMGNTGGTRGARGNKLLSPEANRVQIWRPTWDKNIPTTVRILPAMDYETLDKLIGYRRSTGHSKFTHWCFGCPSVQFVGIDTKFTFLLYHPSWQKSRNYDPSTNPYQILFDEFHQAIKSEEARLGRHDVLTKKWYGLAHDSKNPKRRAFSKVQSSHFYKVFIYAHKDKYMLDAKSGLPFGAGKRDPTLILSVTKTAGESLQGKLNKKVPGVSEDAKMSKLFEYGDITSLKLGKFVTFLGPDHVNSLDFSRYGVKVTDDEAGPQLDDDEGDDDDSGGDDAFNKRWRTHVHREFTYVTKNKKRRTIDADISALRDVVIQKHEWWEDVLQFPTHEQICLWLATGFRSMPNILRYGWRDNKEFMTDEIKGILAARTQGPGAEVPTDDDEEGDEVPDDADVEDVDDVEDEDEEEDERPRKKKDKTRRAASVADDEEDEDEDEDEEGEDDEEETDEAEDEEGEEAEEDEEEDEDEDEPATAYEEEYVGADEAGDDDEEPERPRAKKRKNRPEEPPPSKKLKKRLKLRNKSRAESNGDDEGDSDEGDSDEVKELQRMMVKAREAAKARAQRRNTVEATPKAKKKLRT